MDMKEMFINRMKRIIINDELDGVISKKDKVTMEQALAVMGNYMEENDLWKKRIFNGRYSLCDAGAVIYFRLIERHNNKVPVLKDAEAYFNFIKREAPSIFERKEKLIMAECMELTGENLATELAIEETNTEIANRIWKILKEAKDDD